MNKKEIIKNKVAKLVKLAMDSDDICFSYHAHTHTIDLFRIIDLESANFDWIFLCQKTEYADNKEANAVIKALNDAIERIM